VAVHLRWLERVESTQDVLTAAARAGEPAQAVATTSQTGGRGRRGRVWQCPPGSGLALSVLLRPRRPDRWTWLPLAAGVATADALAGLGATDVVLKWPNDVLAHGGKVAGLLAERVDTALGPALVLGVGVNLRADGLPPQGVALEQVAPATRVDAAAAAAAVLVHLDRVVRGWEHGQDEHLRSRYRSLCSTLGALVQVALPGGQVREGRAVDVDDDGRLVLAVGGNRLALSAGDVVHVRNRGAPPP
jgi:BirA family biotin operon repressor/biotin-[acetyl-CoA-carboxylase] ligase